MAVHENLSDVSDLLNLRVELCELFALNNVSEILEEICSLYFLLLFGIAGIDFPESLFEVPAFIPFKNLLFEIRPVVLQLWLPVNGDYDPFENLVGFGFPVIDIYFGQNLSINFGSQFNPLLPLFQVGLLVDLYLFSIHALFVVAFNVSLINSDLTVEFTHLYL